MKKTFIISSTLAISLLAATVSQAASVCHIDPTAYGKKTICKYDLTDSTLASFEFSFAGLPNNTKDVCFTCSVNSSKETTARIYGGKNAQLNFKGTDKHNISVETGATTPLMATLQKNTDGQGDHRDGELKFDLKIKKSDKQNAKAVVICTPQKAPSKSK